ncbi:hypothetical protein L600_001900000330 [Isoptericola variabilis J7]|nr:hypothetical protein L600_001900000330 [Isoptericola variabilis J7]
MGELVWLAGVAAAVGIVVLVLHLRTRGLPRALSAVLVALAAALFACGVIIDYLHAAVSTPALDPYVTLLEDGGEIAMMSLVVAFLFGVAFVDHRPELRGRWARLSGHAPTSSGRETA